MKEGTVYSGKAHAVEEKKTADDQLEAEIKKATKFKLAVEDKMVAVLRRNADRKSAAGLQRAAEIQACAGRMKKLPVCGLLEKFEGFVAEYTRQVSALFESDLEDLPDLVQIEIHYELDRDYLMKCVAYDNAIAIRKAALMASHLRLGV